MHVDLRIGRSLVNRISKSYKIEVDCASAAHAIVVSATVVAGRSLGCASLAATGTGAGAGRGTQGAAEALDADSDENGACKVERSMAPCCT